MNKLKNIILIILVIIFTFNVLIAPFIILTINKDVQNYLITLWLLFTGLNFCLLLSFDLDKELW